MMNAEDDSESQSRAVPSGDLGAKAGLGDLQATPVAVVDEEYSESPRQSSHPPDAKDESKKTRTENVCDVRLETTDSRDNPVKPSEAEVAEGWEFLLDSAQEYDKKQLEAWTDELNNLLVFAGLFSAVVTAYTIESYQWLQEDPADKTVQLLTQISSQLASFSVTPTFINATVQPILQAPLPFRPDDIYVTINMLWFLSLTLSVLAAFFAIAVQQCLRALLLPQHLSVKDTVYVRNSRHTALVACQVPKIITLLPVLLQVAVIFFLVGLYHFLQGLSHPITTAVTVVAGTPFLLYAASLFLPLVWPACPFKSPLVPSLVFILHWCFIVGAIMGTILVVLPALLLWMILGIIWEIVSKSGSAGDQAADAVILKVTDALDIPFYYIATLVDSALNQSSNWWTVQELRRCARESDTWRFLEPLSWAPNAVPIRQLSRLRPCLLLLETQERSGCVLGWVMLSHLGKYTGVKYGEYWTNDWSPLHLELLHGVNKAFAEQYMSFLLDALPTETEVASCDWVQRDSNLSAVLTLLMQIVKVDAAEPEFRATLLRYIFGILSAQRLDNVKNEMASDYSYARYPAVCLFECSAEHQYNFSIEETSVLLCYIPDRVNELLSLSEKIRANFRINTVELLLGLVAIALVALDQQSRNSCEDSTHDLRRLAREALSAFDRFVESEQNSIQVMGKAALDRPEEPLIINRRAAESIMKSLLNLVSAGYFAPSDIDLVGTLVQHLAETFHDEFVYGAMFPALEQLRILCPVPQPASQPPIGVDAVVTIELQMSGPTGEISANVDSSNPMDAIGNIYGSTNADEMGESSDNLLAAEPNIVSHQPTDEGSVNASAGNTTAANVLNDQDSPDLVSRSYDDALAANSELSNYRFPYYVPLSSSSRVTLSSGRGASDTVTGHDSSTSPS